MSQIILLEASYFISFLHFKTRSNLSQAFEVWREFMKQLVQLLELKISAKRSQLRLNSIDIKLTPVNEEGTILASIKYRMDY